MKSLDLKVPDADAMRAKASISAACRAGLYRVAIVVQNNVIRKVAAIRLERVPTRREAAQHKRRISGTSTQPSRASNQPLWEPSGGLLRSVQAKPFWDGPASIELRADVPYAASRHGLGVEWMPKSPAMGVIRRNPFFTEALEVSGPLVQPSFMDGFNSVWEND